MANACCAVAVTALCSSLTLPCRATCDPEVNKLDGMFVYDVDDLQSVASNNSAERMKEAERAEKIIEFEVDRFASRMKSLERGADDPLAPGIL